MSAAENKAVFLSYASQDAEAARRICDALRAAGVEVWFDQSELRGGDAWDQKIRKQIRDCALFMPIVSANTQARREGYFRLEWKLADDRTHLMARGTPFIVPICIDGTKDWDAIVPDSFMSVQWTRLPGGEATENFTSRVVVLLRGGDEPVSTGPSVRPGSVRAAEERKRPWGQARTLSLVVIAALLLAGGGFALQRYTGGVRPDPAASPGGGSDAGSLLTRVYSILSHPDYSRHDLAAAEDLTRRATELTPDSARAWAARAYVESCYLLRGWETSQKRRQETESFAHRALVLDPKEAEAMLALSVLYRVQRADAQAERVARQALAIRPDDPRIHSALATAIASEDRREEALALRQEAARRFPHDAVTHYNLAIHHLASSERAGDFEFSAAWESVTAALAVKPFYSAQLLKARLLVGWKGDIAGARAMLEQLAPRNRTEPRAVGIDMWIGLLERQLDRVQAAAALTTQTYLTDNVSVANGPKALAVGLALHTAGRHSLARQQWQAAEAVARQHLQDSGDTRVRAYVAIALAWQGRLEEATREIEPLEAAFAEQGLPSRRGLLLAQFYAAAGNAAKAVPYLRQVLNRSPELTDRTLPLDPWWDKLRGQPEFDALLAEAGQRTGSPTTAPAKPNDKSIAVLAFANLSDNKENEYFSDGISEELLNVLAKVPGLRVAARTSAFSFKGKNATAQEIGQKLGVAHLVEGSVRRAGTRVRIAARLSKADTGEQLWSESYDRELKDIFAVQDEIARDIASKLQLTLVGTAPKREVNPEVHRLVLEGRHFWYLRTPDALQRAEETFTQALALDPRFAPAHAGLADACVIQAIYRQQEGLDNYADYIPRTRTAAQSALQLDPTLAEAYPSLGYASLLEGKFAEAEREMLKAIALNPNYAIGHFFYATLLVNLGRLDAALVHVRNAARLDPLAFIIIDRSAEFLYWAGEATEARSTNERAAALRADLFVPNRALAALLLLQAGRQAEAVEAARSVLGAPTVLPRWGSDIHAISILRQAGRDEEASRHADAFLKTLPAESHLRGFVLVALGRLPEALPFLERTPFFQLRWFHFDRIFDPFRDDPRFLQLMEKLGCANEHKVARETLARMLKEQRAKK